MKSQNFLRLVEKSIIDNWDSIAITEYKHCDVYYNQLAKGIAYLHCEWNFLGLAQKDKIAICSSNSINWVITYLAVVSGGYVAVLIPNNITNDEVINIINQSGSVILYTDQHRIDLFSPTQTKCLKYIINIKNGSFLFSSSPLIDAMMDVYLEATDVMIENFRFKTLYNRNCTIIYTSGTTGNPKGVILSFNYISCNIKKLHKRYCTSPRDTGICLNSFYHIMGLLMDVLSPLSNGMRIVILNNYKPSIVRGAFTTYNPKFLFTTPSFICELFKLVFDEKVFEKKYLKDISYYKNQFYNLFGYELKSIIVGGAAIPRDLEVIFNEKLHLPIISAYGTTETGFISLGEILDYKVGSCGKLLNDNSNLIKINSPNPSSSPGEILVKNNIFNGYYKNATANKKSFTYDGWFKTGDIALLDSNQNLFIKGRCDNMIVTVNGENIYPEEIESIINESQYIRESLVISRGSFLHAIIVLQLKKSLNDPKTNEEINDAINKANCFIPGMTVIKTFEIRNYLFPRNKKGEIVRSDYLLGIMNK